MKRIITLVALSFLAMTNFGQAPQKLSYQAVIRNSTGGLIINHAVGMKISILQGSSSGTAVYVETHTLTTNANGLATIEIGGGSIISGTFAGINWPGNTYYLKTETDPSGGTSYTIV
ncbi:MAG TPA: Vir protein, partial [Bacteroidales bacterium]|nr:Vir protein [Bacteroidales bacterium]